MSTGYYYSGMHTLAPGARSTVSDGAESRKRSKVASVEKVGPSVATTGNGRPITLDILTAMAFASSIGYSLSEREWRRRLTEGLGRTSFDYFGQGDTTSSLASRLNSAGTPSASLPHSVSLVLV